MNLTIQSILRGALASVFFALLAVSVSENAAAQTLCPGEVILQDTGRLSGGSTPSFTGNFCVSQADCEASSALTFSDQGLSLCFCAGPQQRLDAGTPDDVSDDICIESCSENAVLTDRSCDCVSPNREINGVCEIRICEADEALLQVAGVKGAGFADGEECVAMTECDSAPNLVVIEILAPNKADAICSCPINTDVRLDHDTPNDLSDDTCNANCPVGSIITGTKCFCSDGVANPGVCAAAESAEECGIVFPDGSQPIFDSNEADSCRPRDQRECSANEEFTASTDPADGGGSCVQCEGHEFSMNGGTCEECAVNTFRGMGASCEACLIANEVRAQGETECSCPDATHYDNPAGTCDERISSACTGIQRYNSADNTCIDCAENEIQSDSDAGSCVACPIANEVRMGSETECSCPDATHYDNPAGTCDDREAVRSSCTGIQRYNSADNTCIDCADNEIQSDSDAGSCTACPPTQVRTGSETECSACPGFANTAEGTCDAIAECTAAQSRLVNNVCTECDTDQHLVNGACVACDPNEVRAQNAAACTCPVFTDTDGSCVPFTECADPLDLNEADNTCFCNSETHFEETDGSCVSHTDCTGEGANVIRNSDDNTCVCADNFEGEAGSCTACVGEYLSENGADCACPQDESFDAGEGVCEINLEGTCTEEPRTFYNPVTNECECPTGQRLNADESACEAIPASSDGGSSNGAVIALVAVPAVLIGGYWLLGGFDYIDPAYGLNYSGENADLRYSAFGGFDLNHGDLSSYVRAVQSDGDAVAYESGISYERDFISLNYDAAESESEYLYDFGAGAKAEFGLWTIAPTAGAEFQYQTEEEVWKSDVSAGLETAWTAQKWTMRARSNFAGDGGHTMDLELRF